ncbi:MAG: gluconokinase [Chloroflexi bacterium]|nr:gluconokinase [Chloroflexota bacterium]
MSVLVVDIGSSSVRALVFDANAQPLPGALAQQAHSFDYSEGGAVADPLALAQRVEQCIDDVLRHPAAVQIHAFGMATFVGNLLGLRDGLPVTPLYTYADTRGQADVDYLKAQTDAQAAHQRTGCRLHTAYHPVRLHWLRRTQPDLFAQVNCWSDLATYLYGRWFGLPVPTSTSVASWNGLLNRWELAWDTEWLRLLQIPLGFLPALADYSAAQRGLSVTFAERWPLLRDVPFYLAVGDGVAANIGSGAVLPGALALSVGTTSAVRQLLPPQPARLPAALWCYQLDKTRTAIGGATSEGGSVFQWARGVLKDQPLESIEAELGQRTPDQHGLTVLPMLLGERAPGWRADASGTLHGLTAATSALDILQALQEGVALRLALIAEQISGENAPVFATGGAVLSSPAWAQTICDALNRRLILVAESEATARGVALLELEAGGGFELNAFPPHVLRTFSPRAQAVHILRAARDRQVDLYRRLYNA